jgi:hypothetical protein
MATLRRIPGAPLERPPPGRAAGYSVFVADPKLLALLDKGVENWNWWREEHPDFQADFSGADFASRNLRGASFQKANLRGCNFSRADLRRFQRVPARERPL